MASFRAKDGILGLFDSSHPQEFLAKDFSVPRNQGTCGFRRDGAPGRSGGPGDGSAGGSRSDRLLNFPS